MRTEIPTATCPNEADENAVQNAVRMMTTNSDRIADRFMFMTFPISIGEI
jgi:hypothetical protein